MSITKTYDVFCDRGAMTNCHGWADGASSTTSAAEARTLAKQLGWKRIGGEDVCPACQQRTEGDRSESPVNSDMSPEQHAYRSMREFCEAFFPKSHAARECACYPKPQGVLVILPRPGVNPQRRGR